MAQMLIRNLDERVVAELKRRAVDNRTSAEEEARRALADSVRLEHEQWLAELDAIRAMSKPCVGSPSLDLLRADRARDD